MSDPATTAPPLVDGLVNSELSVKTAPLPTGALGQSDRPAMLHMRQVAGLTAGSIMELEQGSFQFSESSDEVGFTLTVQDENHIMLIPGTAEAMLDEMVAMQPTELGDAVLNVKTACFVVRPPRTPPSPASRLEAIKKARRSPKVIEVPVFVDNRPLESAASGSWLNSLFSKNDSESQQEETRLDAQSWQFLEGIRQARTVVAERQRQQHPDPEELQSRLSRLDPGLWNRGVDHPLFGRFAIAYATIPWEPKFDNPEAIPERLHTPIEQLSSLPWVPVTANLLFGPLGIVGKRAAALACARHAILSLAALTAPGDLEFSVATDAALADDWDWTSSLPPSMFPTGQASYCVAVADGMHNFDDAGFDQTAVQNNEMGLIALGETIDDIPPYCGTVLQVEADGTGAVTNHLGQRIGGTPVGITTDYAVQMARRINYVMSKSAGA